MEEDLDEIGRFQAERLIEEMIKLVGPFAYNQAIGDARKLVSEKLTNMEEDLYVLEKMKEIKRADGLFFFSFLCSLYSCTFSFTLPTVSLAVPFTLSHFPSACNFYCQLLSQQLLLLHLLPYQWHLLLFLLNHDHV